MKNGKEIQEAISVANKIREIVEGGFDHVPVSKETPRVFEYACKICQCRVGQIERLEHLQKKHDLPYFPTGVEALKWVIT